jgi:hypothetical protein
MTRVTNSTGNRARADSHAMQHACMPVLIEAASCPCSCHAHAGCWGRRALNMRAGSCGSGRAGRRVGGRRGSLGSLRAWGPAGDHRVGGSAGGPTARQTDMHLLRQPTGRADGRTPRAAVGRQRCVLAASTGAATAVAAGVRRRARPWAHDGDRRASPLLLPHAARRRDGGAARGVRRQHGPYPCSPYNRAV